MGTATQVSSQSAWYTWVEESLIPYLFLEKWYNDDPRYKIGFVADNEPSKVLALARFRQLRVQKSKLLVVVMVLESGMFKCHDHVACLNAVM